MLTVGLGIVGAFVSMALFAPLVAPYDPIYQDAAAKLLSPSWAHPFGTDNFGRDVLSRVIWGARVDLQIAVIGVVFPFLIGTTVGTLAGFFGGWVDAVFMRIVDVVLAFPVPRADAVDHRHPRPGPRQLLHRHGAGRLGHPTPG